MIDRDKLYTYLDKFHGPIEMSTNGWHTCDCLLCGKKKKFAINFSYLTGKCWSGCFSGFIIDAIRLSYGLSYFEAHELIDAQESGMLKIPSGVSKAQREAKIALPYGYHPILEGTTNLAYRAREYLQNRGFDLNYLDRIGVGYCNEIHENPVENYFGRIIIPLKKNGILSYFIGRDFIGDYLRYKNPAKELCGTGKADLLFNEEALFIHKKVYLTEGWACAATMGPEGISQQGSIPSTIQRNVIIKSPVEEVIIVPDAGFYSHGLQAAREIMRHKKVKVINLDYFEQTGIGKDINDIGKENLWATENKTQWIDVKFLFHQMKVYANKRISNTWKRKEKHEESRSSY
jgi:hypothetical protein